VGNFFPDTDHHRPCCRRHHVARPSRRGRSRAIIWAWSMTAVIGVEHSPNLWSPT